MPDLYLLRSSLRDLARPRKLAAAGLLTLLPMGAGLLWRFRGQRFVPAMAFNLLEMTLVFGFVLVILSVVFGAGALSAEIEARTLPYLLTRPLPRWRILLVKLAAALVGVTATAWVATILLAVACYGFAGLGHSPLGRYCLILPLGALAYSCLFLLFSTFLARPVLIGVLFAFGWESWVPQLPGSFARLSLMVYLRALAPRPPSGEAPDASPFFSALAPGSISHATATWTLVLVAAACLAIAILIFSVREYLPREDID